MRQSTRLVLHQEVEPSVRSSILLVGDPGIVHVGAHLHRAAADLGLRQEFVHSTEAFAGSVLRSKLNWWLRGHRPPRLREFGKRVAALCESLRPDYLIATGLAPLDAQALAAIGELGTRRLNYLTDDPWNPAHHASWFLEALAAYDHVFSPRRANLDDLRNVGGPRVSYLPFAYAPELHFPERQISDEQRPSLDFDIVFAGGADRDRVPYVAALINAGFKVGLYGGYWERFTETRSASRGHADPPTLRKAIDGAKVALCLVRRANRDGHAMRTFEVAAMGGCMLTEETDEHRDIFGPDCAAVVYFNGIGEMLEKLRWLLEHDEERRCLAHAAHTLVTRGGHTYGKRVEEMLRLADASA